MSKIRVGNKALPGIFLLVIEHYKLGEDDNKHRKKLHSLLRAGKLKYAGNKKLKIYGTLRCSSGKRMKMTNRVFFISGEEAIDAGYRPCGHCLYKAYKEWCSSKGR
jgi:methylphosphotriester-DNA--protein-cysteine methyltransferase